MKSKLIAKINIRDNGIYNKSNIKKFAGLFGQRDMVDIKVPFNDISDLVSFKILTELDYIIVETEILLGEFKFSDDDLEFYKTKENIVNVIKKLLLQEFEVRINDLFIALQISQPGRIDFLDIKLFQDDIPKSTTYYEKLISPANAYLIGNDVINKEIIDIIDFSKVWEWLINQDDFWNEVPNNEIGTLLNYFRYFNYESSPLNFIWIAMGLEAILVTNERFSISQLKGKLKLLLKEFHDESEINKFVEAFYKLRSKIAHGKQKLFRPTIMHDALDSVAKIDNEFWSNGEFGYTALIYCIQFMIKTNRNKLEFKEEIIYTLLD